MDQLIWCSTNYDHFVRPTLSPASSVTDSDYVPMGEAFEQGPVMTNIPK